MKHIKTLTTVTASLALLGISVPVLANNTNVVQAKVKKSATYKDSTASLTFTKANGYKIIGSDKTPLYNEIVLTGKFTNKSKHSMKPYTFFTKHFRVTQNAKNTKHELSALTGYITSAPTKEIKVLGSNAHSSVNPGKTVKFALCDDTLPITLKNNQKVTISIHKNAYLPTKKLSYKTFSVGKLVTTMDIADQEFNEKFGN